MASPNWTASGNISPCRFVVVSGTDTVAQATGTSSVIAGISGQSPEVAPIPLYGTAAYCATSGNPVLVYGVTEMALLEIASGVTVTAGQRLTSDGSGMGTSASTGNNYGALALRSNNGTGGFYLVQVLTGIA